MTKTPIYRTGDRLHLEVEVIKDSLDDTRWLWVKGLGADTGGSGTAVLKGSLTVIKHTRKPDEFKVGDVVRSSIPGHSKVPYTILAIALGKWWVTWDSGVNHIPGNAIVSDPTEYELAEDQ